MAQHVIARQSARQHSTTHYRIEQSRAGHGKAGHGMPQNRNSLHYTYFVIRYMTSGQTTRQGNRQEDRQRQRWRGGATDGGTGKYATV